MRRGRRRFYSDLAITCALTLREVYHLPLRATQGFVRSVLSLLGTDSSAPHYSTLSRRAATLDVEVPRLSKGPLHLAADSTGPKLHGKEQRRTWRKLHLLVDHRIHKALACAMSEQYVLDRKELPGLRRGVEGEVAELLSDRAYDFQGCYKAIHARRAFSHPAASAGAGEERGGVRRPQRGGAARAGGREEWKKAAGYHRRSLAETAMMSLRTIFSDRLKTREWRRQETELRVRCAVTNKMTSLGMPRSYAVTPTSQSIDNQSRSRLHLSRFGRLRLIHLRPAE